MPQNAALSSFKMTSLSQGRLIDRIKRLLSDRHFRDCEREFVVESVLDLKAAVEGGHRISVILITKRVLMSLERQPFFDLLTEKEPLIVRVCPKVTKALSTSPHNPGIVTVIATPTRCLKDNAPIDGKCWLAISRIRSTGNFGTLIRSAVAAEVQGLILIGRASDPFDPRATRPAMGAILRLPILRLSWPNFKDWAATHLCEVVGACPSATTELWNSVLPMRTVFMLGEERTGLSGRQRKSCDRLVRIPMNSKADSLNLGVSGSLLAYEFHRRFHTSE